MYLEVSSQGLDYHLIKALHHCQVDKGLETSRPFGFHLMSNLNVVSPNEMAKLHPIQRIESYLTATEKNTSVKREGKVNQSCTNTSKKKMSFENSEIACQKKKKRRKRYM